MGLPDRTYWKHGQGWYVHRDGRWEALGTDIVEVKRKGTLYNDPNSVYGTMAWYLDAWVIHCEKLVKRGDMAKRTYEDYKEAVIPLKVFFGTKAPSAIQPKHVGKYLDIGAEAARPVRANREKAALSSCLTWLIRTGEGGLMVNPCFGVHRNREEPRTRYVEDAEYSAVHAVAHRSVRGAMGLIYRTLQRPDDVLSLSRANLVTKSIGGAQHRILRLTQSKTKRLLEIQMSPEIDAILVDLAGDNRKIEWMTLVHNGKGKRYTESGLVSMLRRACIKAKVKPFGLQDCKSKGATDMYLAGVPLEQIQALCGHESVTTTEIYVKRHLTMIAAPNKVAISGV